MSGILCVIAIPYPAYFGNHMFRSASYHGTAEANWFGPSSFSATGRVRRHRGAGQEKSLQLRGMGRAGVWGSCRKSQNRESERGRASPTSRCIVA